LEKNVKHIFITGVSSGFGHGLAKVALQEGHIVYGISRRHPEDLQQFPNFHFHNVDLSRLNRITLPLMEFLQDTPSLDLIILNAGVLGGIRDLRECDIESLRSIMDVNVWANKLILDTLLAMHTRIEQVVAVSSGASVTGARGWGGYGISKAALNMLIRLYATEVPSVHFVSLAPGLIHTAMQEYINTVPDPLVYPVVQRLRDARGTDSMPEPEKAARLFYEAIEKCKSLESGSYADIRNL
jgi:NAD(P)-dependent dehydrogenase (short-subunit alcohol dehydrogenase family)